MARVLLLGLILTVLSACGGDGEGSAADEGPAIPYRVLERSFLTFSPDPPSPTTVVAEPLTGTFTVTRVCNEVPYPCEGVTIFLFRVAELHLSAGRFAIDGEYGSIQNRLLREPDGTEQGLFMSLQVLINGERVFFEGQGPYRFGDGELVLDGVEICTPSSRLRPCGDIRIGNSSGFFLRIYARPQS